MTKVPSSALKTTVLGGVRNPFNFCVSIVHGEISLVNTLMRALKMHRW
jgi:hypothetical protein